MGALLEKNISEIQSSDIPEQRPARLSFGLEHARLIREKHANGELSADEAEYLLKHLKQMISKKASRPFWSNRLAKKI